MYKANDFYLRNIDNEDRFKFINDIVQHKLGLTDGQIQAVDEMIDDIAKNAIQKGFFDGIRCERDKK